MSEPTPSPAHQATASFEEWLESHKPSNYSDDMEDAYQHGRSSRNAEVCQLLDTIRNQNSHMAWLEGQLQEGAARERAYLEAINDLCDEVTRIHAKAKAVLEGRPDPADGDENSVCTCPGGPPTPGGDFDLHVDGCPRPCRWELAPE